MDKGVLHMNDFYVYVYWRLDTNEIFYVGKGRDDRWRRLNKRSEHFKKIINKYDIACEILADNLSEEEAHGIEVYLINELVFNYGYSIDISNNRSKEYGCHLVNASWGGEGVSGNNPFEKMSEETKKRWIESHRGLKPMLGKRHTKEAKIKIGHASRGRKFSDDHRRKISEANKGKSVKPVSDETRRKISESGKGRVVSDETRRKISESNKGKHHTKETKEKLMLKRGNKIIAVNIEDGSKLFFNSIREAHRNGFNRSCISQCLNPSGNQTTHKGYKWYNLNDWISLDSKYV